jgi:hypothetical protein
MMMNIQHPNEQGNDRLQRLLEACKSDSDAEAYYLSLNESITGDQLDRVREVFGYWDTFYVVIFMSKAQ